MSHTLFQDIRDTFTKAATLDVVPEFLVNAEIDRVANTQDGSSMPAVDPEPVAQETPGGTDVGILAGATGIEPGGTIVLQPINVDVEGSGLGLFPLLAAGGLLLFFTTRN